MAAGLSQEKAADALGVRQKYISAPYPASTFLVVTGLAAPEFLVEIEIIATVG